MSATEACGVVVSPGVLYNFLSNIQLLEPPHNLSELPAAPDLPNGSLLYLFVSFICLSKVWTAEANGVVVSAASAGALSLSCRNLYRHAESCLATPNHVRVNAKIGNHLRQK